MKMSPKEIEAKLKAIEMLLHEATAMEGDDMDGHLKDLKKVTVASNDKSGLEQGLDKAKELLGQDMPEMDDSKDMHKMGDKYMKNEDMPDDMDAKEDSSAEEMAESPEEEKAEMESEEEDKLPLKKKKKSNLNFF